MRGVVLGGAVALFGLGACATGGDEIAGPPTLTETPGSPAPPQARFYADCIAQAAGARTFDRENNTLRFRCTGAPARAFFDGMAAWTAARPGMQVTEGGRTWRYTQPIRRNPSGLDYCVMDGAGEHRCVVVLNVGAFLG